jgi:hypothetical protein
MPNQPKLAQLQLSEVKLAGMPSLPGLTKLKMSDMSLAGMRLDLVEPFLALGDGRHEFVDLLSMRRADAQQS